jgi:hypothetical protein
MYFVTNRLKCHFFTVPFSLSINIILIQINNLINLDIAGKIIIACFMISIIQIIIKINKQIIKDISLYLTTYYIFIFIFAWKSTQFFPNLHPDIISNLLFLSDYEINKSLINYPEGYFNLAEIIGFNTKNDLFYFYWGAFFGAIVASYAFIVLFKLYSLKFSIIFMTVCFLPPFNIIYKWMSGTWSFSVVFIAFFLILYLIENDKEKINYSVAAVASLSFFGIGLIHPSLGPQFVTILIFVGFILRNSKIIILAILVNFMNISIFFDPIIVNSSKPLNLFNLDLPNISRPGTELVISKQKVNSSQTSTIIDFFSPSRFVDIFNNNLIAFTLYGILIFILILAINNIKKSKKDKNIKMMLVFFIFIFVSGSGEFGFFIGRAGIIVLMMCAILTSKFIMTRFLNRSAHFTVFLIIVLVMTKFSVPTYFTNKDEQLFKEIVFSVKSYQLQKVATNQFRYEAQLLYGNEIEFVELEDRFKPCSQSEQIAFIGSFVKPENIILNGSLFFNITGAPLDLALLNNSLNQLISRVVNSNNGLSEGPYSVINCEKLMKK